MTFIKHDFKKTLQCRAVCVQLLLLIGECGTSFYVYLQNGNGNIIVKIYVPDYQHLSLFLTFC